MFKSKERYVTKQVAAEIPVSIQRFLWYLIDEEVRKDKDLDYLQIFEVKPVQAGQIVIHRQEQPKRNQELFLPVEDNKRISKTIWVIDSGYQTMLLPEEY